MPTQAEYKSLLDGIADSILGQHETGKQGARSRSAAANRAVIAGRIKARQEISNRWKTRFAEIKKENDELQKEAKDNFEGEHNACCEYDMRKRDDCEDQYPVVKGSRGSGFVMCIRQAQIEFVGCKKLCRENLINKTKEITNRWKAEFGRIKVENDEFERNLLSAFNDTMQYISEWLGDMLE